VSLAPFARRELLVAANEPLGPYRLLHVRDPDGPQPDPGQFAMLAAVEGWGGGSDERPYLARALSVARQSGRTSIYLLEDVGPGTRRLCELAEGARVWSVGPLGRGFSLPDPGERPILVGGGVGIAPLAILSDRIAPGPSAPCRIMLGFRDGAHAAGAALFDSRAELATDDGSAGHHGPVTDLLAAALASEDAATPRVYACGPPAMLEAVRALCWREGVSAELALEAPMACGFGACFGCVVPSRGGGYLRVCVDGPVLDAAELATISVQEGALAMGEPA
jgi:dihydroorotate dehydrogenase electron transfer subunit